MSGQRLSGRSSHVRAVPNQSAIQDTTYRNERGGSHWVGLTDHYITLIVASSSTRWISKVRPRGKRSHLPIRNSLTRATSFQLGWDMLPELSSKAAVGNAISDEGDDENDEMEEEG